MTDLVLKRGDSRNYQVTITDDDLVTPIDLTDAILKFSVKSRYGLPNSSSVIHKRSYDVDEIEKTDPVNGICVVKVTTEDTFNKKPGSYCWDIEMTRPAFNVTNVGTIAVAPGSGLMTGTGLDLSSVKVGDVLTPSGVDPANQVPVTITAVGGSGEDDDPGAGNLLTDYADWAAEAGIAIDIDRGNRKTPEGLSGAFTLEPDVTT